MLLRGFVSLAAPLALLAGSILAVPGGPTPPSRWSEGWVFANGLRMHYWRTGGDRPPLVLAHGLTDDSLCWANLAKDLEDSFDIIMLDARGHGLTDPPAASDPSDVMVEDLAAFLREMKIEKPILMGHSMGGSTIAWFATRYPDVPRAVVLVDPGGWSTTANAPARPVDSRPSPDLEKQRAAILAINNTPHAELVEACLKANPKRPRGECEATARADQLYHPNNVWRQRGGTPPMRDMIAGIAAPTLILKADAQGDARRANEEAARPLKNGKLIHVEGAGHNVHMEQRERTAAAFKTWVAGM